jgi:polyisoprenoid-binding protein YceI
MIRNLDARMRRNGDGQGASAENTALIHEKLYVATNIVITHLIRVKGAKDMATTLNAPAIATTWKLDPVHSVAEFRVKHMMISNVKGQFTGISGALELDENNIANSRVEATIDASTIQTGDAQRDGHLKSADFFEVEKYPTLSFQSTNVTRTPDGDLSVAGDLTIHGVTRQVVFEVEGPTAQAKDPWGNTRVGLSATTKISRKDFGLTWNAALEAGGFLVGDQVTITLDIQFVQA